MNIILATDHAGFELKEIIKRDLESQGHIVTDCGAHDYDALDDYPDMVGVAGKELERAAAGRPLSSDPDTYAIVLGGSGTGEMIVMNRFPHVRCAVYAGAPLATVELARQHNNANALSIGARFVDAPAALSAISVFIHTPFENGRHLTRIQKIPTYE